MNTELMIEVVPGDAGSNLPGRIRRYFHTTLVGLHDAVTEAGGTLEGAFWTVDAQDVEELKKLCEQAGFTVRVL